MNGSKSKNKGIDNKTRILLNSGGEIRRLCNIVKCFDKNGCFYEHKITFPGFGNSSLLDDCEIDSVNGPISLGQELETGKFEVCYHSEGGISYKNVFINKHHWKSKVQKKQINSEQGYCFFLRIIAKFEKLPVFEKSLRKIDRPLDVKYKNGCLSVDFYLSQKEITFNVDTKFCDSKQFLFKDEEDGSWLNLHIYQAGNINGIYIIIP